MPNTAKSMPLQSSIKNKNGIAANLANETKNRRLASLNYFSLGISTLNILIVLLLQKNLPPQVPLYYGLPDGEAQLSTNIMLVIPGAVSLSIFVINLILAKFLQNEFLKQSLMVAAFAVVVLTAATTLKIIFLIGSF